MGRHVGDRLRGFALLVVLALLALFAGSALLQWWEPPKDQRVVEPVVNPGERIRVEVRNAGGLPGMARSATDLLRDAGFDVVELGNASAFDRETSIVLARLGRTDWAGSVAEALGIAVFADEPDSTIFVDVTVLLGRDWGPASATPDRESERDEPWWDLRSRWRE